MTGKLDSSSVSNLFTDMNCFSFFYVALAVTSYVSQESSATHSLSLWFGRLSLHLTIEPNIDWFITSLIPSTLRSRKSWLTLQFSWEGHTEVFPIAYTSDILPGIAQGCRVWQRRSRSPESVVQRACSGPGTYKPMPIFPYRQQN